MGVYVDLEDDVEKWLDNGFRFFPPASRLPPPPSPRTVARKSTSYRSTRSTWNVDVPEETLSIQDAPEGGSQSSERNTPLTFFDFSAEIRNEIYRLVFLENQGDPVLHSYRTEFIQALGNNVTGDMDSPILARCMVPVQYDRGFLRVNRQIRSEALDLICKAPGAWILIVSNIPGYFDALVKHGFPAVLRCALLNIQYPVATVNIRSDQFPNDDGDVFLFRAAAFSALLHMIHLTAGDAIANTLITLECGNTPSHIRGIRSINFLITTLRCLQIIGFGAGSWSFVLKDKERILPQFPESLRNVINIDYLTAFIEEPTTADKLERIVKRVAKITTAYEYRGDWERAESQYLLFFIVLHAVQHTLEEAIPVYREILVHSLSLQMGFRVWAKRFASNLANVMHKQGKHKHALEWINCALRSPWFEANPSLRQADDDHGALIRRGLIHAALHNYREAINDFQRGVETCPTDYTTVKDLAESTISSWKSDPEALKVLQEMQKERKDLLGLRVLRWTC
ncbi:hypothetical protein NA57DRAFT_50884 [Rhizodiscina lignyota]|uniref:TPR-like protein n=1 Tax=Rhizodiscina lignyota TaxID=1504668 RepID=A0A9P4MB67_9PEZI|nr:hypothetical protein NA57DRAFT_50884 [Rhizodiscina lignyota]